MRPLFIFDLDGTLALTEHRQHLVQRPPDCQKRTNVPDPHCTCSEICLFRPDWPAFFAASVNDTPNAPVVRTMQLLEAAGAELWIWSGRSDEVRAETIAWMRVHDVADLRLSGIMGSPYRFRMRMAGDHRADHIVKAEWLAEIEQADRDRLVAIFDDRDSVVAAWRAAGVPCFQVAPGAF